MFLIAPEANVKMHTMHDGSLCLVRSSPFDNLDTSSLNMKDMGSSTLTASIFDELKDEESDEVPNPLPRRYEDLDDPEDVHE